MGDAGGETVVESLRFTSSPSNGPEAVGERSSRRVAVQEEDPGVECRTKRCPWDAGREAELCITPLKQVQETMTRTLRFFAHTYEIEIN